MSNRKECCDDYYLCRNHDSWYCDECRRRKDMIDYFDNCFKEYEVEENSIVTETVKEDNSIVKLYTNEPEHFYEGQLDCFEDEIYSAFNIIENELYSKEESPFTHIILFKKIQ